MRLIEIYIIDKELRLFIIKINNTWQEGNKLDKANIIISVIIVLCIAAAVAAYGITNSGNPIFSDLSSMSAKDDNAGHGVGNNSNIGNNSGSSVATTTGSSSSTGSSGSGSSSGSSSSGGSSSGGSSNSRGSGSGSNGGGSSNTHLSYSSAKAIANDAILEEGCYAGSGYYSGGYWYFNVYDAKGNVVDTIAVNDKTGFTERA